MGEWSYVTAAYGLTWAVLIGYAATLVRRSVRARRELQRVERADRP